MESSMKLPSTKTLIPYLKGLSKFLDRLMCLREDMSDIKFSSHTTRSPGFLKFQTHS